MTAVVAPGTSDASSSRRRDTGDVTDELKTAIEAARDAGRISVERFQKLERIMLKGEKDVVTEVDHLAEAAIIDRVRRRFPDDPFLAEESGHSQSTAVGVLDSGAAASGPVSPEHRIWIVDPIDGTVNYANGIPHFCVSVALVIGGLPVVGVVLDPLRDELFHATRDGGAWLDGESIRHPAKERLGDAVISIALPASRFARREARIRKAIRVGRTMGSAALALTWTANGRFDAFVQLRGLSLWDIAAAGLIAEEAGVLVTAVTGGPWFDLVRGWRGSGIVAAAAAHQPTLLEMLR